MRAMRIHQYGDASVIRDEDVPRPVAGHGEVLIRVAATSFSPSDVGFRRGLLRHVRPVALPHTLGGEVAGTVVAVGSGVRTFAVGSRVIGRVDRGGAAAEYVAAPAGTLATAPTTIPLAHAAAIPVAGVTAWQAVFEHARITAGQRVLVNGAGGGVGGYAVQLAKHAGAHVIATAGPRSAEAVRRQGADEIVDYRVAPLPGQIDVVLHLVPGYPGDLSALLRPGGLVVSAVGPVASGVHFVARNDLGHLASLVEMVDAGALQVDVASRRPLAELAAVHREAEAGLLRGKTILDIV